MSKFLEGEEGYEIFFSSVNKRHFRDYLNYVPLEMNLNKILLRIQNKFYMSMKQLKADIELIDHNCKRFNQLNSELCQLSEKFVSELKNFVKSIRKPTLSDLEISLIKKNLEFDGI